MACLEAHRGPPKGMVIPLPTEPMVTTRPRAARTSGSIAWVTATWPKTLTSNWRRRASRSTHSTGLARPMPALLTSPSRWPWSASMRAAAAHLRRVGDVEAHRDEGARAGRRPVAGPPVEGGDQARSVGVLADAGVDGVAGAGEAERGGAADAGRGAGDEDDLVWGGHGGPSGGEESTLVALHRLGRRPLAVHIR